jgi:hypothetical protein
MSKHNNVNPNFYKVGGREHAEGHGEAIPHDQEKQNLKTGGSHNRKNQPLPGNKDRGQNR